MSYPIVLDKDHTLNVGPGAVVSFVTFGVFFILVGFFDVDISFSIRMLLAAIETAIICYNCDIDGKPLSDIFFEKKPVKF